MHGVNAHSLLRPGQRCRFVFNVPKAMCMPETLKKACTRRHRKNFVNYWVMNASS
jgi:hypothetical protein